MQFKTILFTNPKNNSHKFIYVDARAWGSKIPLTNLNLVSATRYSPIKYIRVKKS